MNTNDKILDYLKRNEMQIHKKLLIETKWNQNFQITLNCNQMEKKQQQQHKALNWNKNKIIIIEKSSVERKWNRNEQ